MFDSRKLIPIHFYLFMMDLSVSFRAEEGRLALQLREVKAVIMQIELCQCYITINEA